MSVFIRDQGRELREYMVETAGVCALPLCLPSTNWVTDDDDQLDADMHMVYVQDENIIGSCGND